MAGVKLGTRLLRDGVIGLSELEAGLRAQVLYGGRLGTNLVELGFVDVDTLGRYLSLSLGAPEATRERFESASQTDIDEFGAENARRFVAFPLGAEPDGTFAVVVLNPLDTITLLELEKAIGKPIRPFAAGEMRIYYYLEKHYSIERGVRFVRTSSPPREQGSVERRRVQGAPRMVRVEPRRARVEKGPKAKPLASVENLVQSIDSATDRAAIGEAIVRYGEGRVDVLLTLLIRDGKAMGWLFHSIHDEASVTSVDQLSLDLTELSVLSLAYGASEQYWGPPPMIDGEIERKMWWATGARRRPERCLVVPVMVKDRVVQLIYAHNLAELPSSHRRELATISARAGEAYLRLIRLAKNS